MSLQQESFDSYKEYANFYQSIDTKKIFDFKKDLIRLGKQKIEIIIAFLKIINRTLSSFQIDIKDIYSISSWALKIFQKNFSKKKITFRYNCLEHNYLKNAYFGGRCEVYGNPKKEEKIFYYDFPGMYAQCMQEKFAYGACEFKNNLSNYSHPGFYCIEYDSNLSYPILPYKSVADQKLLFVNGRNTGIF